MAPDPSVVDPMWAHLPVGQARTLAVAAVEAFAKSGFHATTSREIAAAAGMSPAGVYVHFASKADLLAVISLTGHRAALDVVETGLGSEPGGIERLAHTIGDFARWHADNHLLARVVQHELAALPVAQRRKVEAIRRRTQQLVRDEVALLVDQGESDVDDVRSTSRALLSLCIDVSRWYRPRGGQSPTAIGAAYADLTRRILTRG
ncbi:MAG TPA: TetR/AcrR family transcriptional regulator [Protaetiibacter sp.]|nr:TetR/AcrR family transcriptional regulator [Protaetiibacter sp.]